MTKKMTAALLFALLGASGMSCAAGDGGVTPLIDPLLRPAQITPRAPGAVMLAVTRAGDRLVAAGERGIILWSDDNGTNWSQAAVPVSVTLTALIFPTASQGWAVGHGGTVLHTKDGGRRWELQLDGRALARLELEAARKSGDEKRIKLAEQLSADGPDKPLLAVHFWNERRGFVIGAYGLIAGTEDGGMSWQSWINRVDNPRGLHLNALHVGSSRIYLAGEQGIILRSDDGAKTFRQLTSPYKGSWFAIAGINGRILIGGLRGTVFHSTDGGAAWQELQVPAPATVTSAIVTSDGKLLVSNQTGMLMQPSDNFRSLTVVPPPIGQPITALAQAKNGNLVAATFSGFKKLAHSGR